MDFGLVDGGNSFVQRVERAQLQIVAKGVSVQFDFVETSRTHQGLNLASVIVDARTDEAELFIDQFQHSRKTIQVAQVFLGYFETRFVTRIVIEYRPHVL